MTKANQGCVPRYSHVRVLGEQSSAGDGCPWLWNYPFLLNYSTAVLLFVVTPRPRLYRSLCCTQLSGVRVWDTCCTMEVNAFWLKPFLDDEWVTYPKVVLSLAFSCITFCCMRRPWVFAHGIRVDLEFSSKIVCGLSFSIDRLKAGTQEISVTWCASTVQHASQVGYRPFHPR